MNSNDPDPTTMGTPADFSATRSYGLSGRIMLSAIVILFFVVILMISLHLYARWYILHGRRRYLPRRIRRNRRPTTVLFVDPSAVSTAEARGLDPSVIKSLPVFDFSAATHPDPIECAVCLSEFEENESGRVLPNCKHTFHVECIDMWFLSHSTCPLCRSLVEPFAGEEIPAAEEVVIAIPDDPVVENDPGKSFGVCDSCDSGRLSSYEAGTSTAKVGRLKPAAIEVPRRNPGEFEDEWNRSESPSSHSFRSPMSRMLSFKRILNRDRRTLPSPSFGAHSPAVSGSSSSMTESDIERGREENR